LEADKAAIATRLDGLARRPCSGRQFGAELQSYRWQ